MRDRPRRDRIVMAVVIVAALPPWAACGGAAGLVIRADGPDAAVEWKGVRLVPPVFRVADGTQPAKLDLVSHRMEDGQARLEYRLAVSHGGATRRGRYRLAYAVSPRKDRATLTQTSDLELDGPLRLDLTVAHTIQVPGGRAGRLTLPLRNGVVKGVPLGGPRGGAGHFVLGRGATPREGHELALPVIGLGFDRAPEGTLALATDPYCGVQFRVAHRSSPKQPAAVVTAATTYTGSRVPLARERRTLVLARHKGGVDGMLRTFYDTIPDIQPGAPWIHDIQLTYYDYLSDRGRGWFQGLAKLAEKIPRAHRKAVVANLHGWYDYLGRYCYDHKTGKLDDRWTAFPRTRKTPMSKAEIHKRVRFAKDLGFRVVLYFADGLNCDSSRPGFRGDWLFRDERGQVRKGWTGPSTGKTYAVDPSHPEVRRWFLGYADALLAEYGREVDGLGWDETHYIAQEKLSKGARGLAYADRDFMTLVAAVTRRVQAYRKANPNLVFLTSDCLGGWARGLPPYVPYALVSHGTWQDTWMNPGAWGPGLLPNYRNCLWSCNWGPVKHRDRNRIAAEQYGLPQGLSNGYGDDRGPAEMPPALLDEVIGRFLARAAKGGRTRYLTRPAVHHAAAKPPCTTREDAAGGCDGVRNGFWGFCTHHEANPWWQVDLGRSMRLDRIVIYNRCDGRVEGRAARLQVLLSGDGRTWAKRYQHDGKPFFGHTDGKPLVVSLKGASARFVRIRLPATEYLHLDEVEVYSGGSDANVALHRPADQSSVSPWSFKGPAKPKAR